MTGTNRTNGARPPTLIAQMTDIHIGFAPDERPEELNMIRFRATLDRLRNSSNRPDCLILSGDLTDRGDAESFAKFADELEGCTFPVHPMVGNHDTREGLLTAFPGTPREGGFIHYGFDLAGLRVVCLDTLEPGRHGGAFCAQRAEWLRAKLAERPDLPTVIFMHHPPVVAGIEWMDPRAEEDWIARFGEAIAGFDQLVAIHCGHLHRPIATVFQGVPLMVTPSCAPLVAMDLRPIDPSHPDGRNLITTESPSYALHRWDGRSLVSHYEDIDDWRVLASFNEALQPMIEEMIAERG